MNRVVFAAALGAVVLFGGSAAATRVAVSASSAVDVSILRSVIGGLLARGASGLRRDLIERLRVRLGAVPAFGAG